MSMLFLFRVTGKSWVKMIKYILGLSFKFFAQAARLLLFSLDEKSRQKNQVSLILVFSKWKEN